MIADDERRRRVHGDELNFALEFGHDALDKDTSIGTTWGNLQDGYFS